VEGGGPAGLGAQGTADDGEGRADEQAGALGRGGLAPARGQAGPAAEVGADRAPQRPRERPGERLAVAHRGGQLHDGRGQRQHTQDPPVDQRPPRRLDDPAGRRPHRRVVGGPGQPNRRLHPRLGRRDQVMGPHGHLHPGLEHPTHHALDHSPMVLPTVAVPGRALGDPTPGPRQLGEAHGRLVEAGGGDPAGGRRLLLGRLGHAYGLPAQQHRGRVDGVGG
jgi:hypothetical protein